MSLDRRALSNHPPLQNTYSSYNARAASIQYFRGGFAPDPGAAGRGTTLACEEVMLEKHAVEAFLGAAG